MEKNILKRFRLRSIRNIFIAKRSFLSFNGTHLRSCAFCHTEPEQFFIYIYLSLPRPSFRRNAKCWRTPPMRETEREQKSRGKRSEGQRERMIITECHFGDIMQRARANVLYNGVTSHRLHNHNTKSDIMATYLPTYVSLGGAKNARTCSIMFGKRPIIT